MNDTEPPQTFGRNYYGGQADAGGFRFRIEGKDVISEVIDSLRGGVTIGKYGKKEFDEQYRMMNDLGISRAATFLKGVVNKNTHLSKYPDKETIMEQVRALSKEWCVTIAINRKKWDVKDPDLVQVVVETAILSSILRADDGFEAQISGKSHQVMETVNTMTGQQQGGFFSRLNPFKW